MATIGVADSFIEFASVIMFSRTWQGKLSRYSYICFTGWYVLTVLTLYTIDVNYNKLFCPMFVLLTMFQSWSAIIRRFRGAGINPVRVLWWLIPVVGWTLVTYWAFWPDDS